MVRRREPRTRQPAAPAPAPRRGEPRRGRTVFRRARRGSAASPHLPRLMRDLGTAVALVLVIEGVLYALFPDGMKRIAARAMLVPPQSLRIAGLVAALLGVVLVWLLRR